LWLKSYDVVMADELQALLASQLGERQAREVYARVLDAALHLQELLTPAAPGWPGVDSEAASEPGEVLQARLRNAARAQVFRDRLLEGALTGRELAEKLGISVQAVDQARRADKIMALRSGDSWLYPIWQLDFSAPDPFPPHLPELAKAGVQILVCGQSAASGGYTKAMFLEPVDVALSAMTAFAVLQERGYHVNPF